jgi:hypothetical protein
MPRSVGRWPPNSAPCARQSRSCERNLSRHRQRRASRACCCENNVGADRRLRVRCGTQPAAGKPTAASLSPRRPVQPVYLRPHRHPRSRRCPSKAGTAAGQALHGYTLEFPTELVPLARPRRGRALGRAVLAAFAFIVVSREQIRAAGAPDPYRRHRHTPGLDAIGTALAAPEPCPD